MTMNRWVNRQGWKRLCNSGQGWLRRLGLFVLVLMVAWGMGTLGAIANDYNKEILRNHDFSGQDLTDSSFTKAELKGSDFSNSNLSGVSFFAADLEATNLEGANLSYATLDSARFARANLTNAILEGAFAYTAEFRGATITGADFTNAELLGDELEVLCNAAEGTNPTTGRRTKDTLECLY